MKWSDRECLDFACLTDIDAEKVKDVIARGENFAGYIPADSVEFIIRNYKQLAKLSLLEAPWLDAYVHATDFNNYGLQVIKAVFDACDRDRLLELKPLGDTRTYAREGRLTLFRGCAGSVHTMGMSWIPSLDKAIWYAAKHAECHGLDNRAVYVATVPVADVYCRLDSYDDDFIASPHEAWRVEVPAGEFRLDRPR